MFEIYKLTRVNPYHLSLISILVQDQVHSRSIFPSKKGGKEEIRTEYVS